MAKSIERMSLSEMQTELEYLRNSAYVELAMKEAIAKDRLGQMIAKLRRYEDRGHELVKAGYSVDSVDALIAENEVGA